MPEIRWILLTLTAALVGGHARADIPPPPGRTRVSYAFQIDAVPAGMTAIAFPGYSGEPDSHVIRLQPGVDVPSFQGYTPGLYLLPGADAAALSGKADDAVTAHLAATGRQCLLKIPRVFEVDTITGIEKMTDVIRLDATGTTCEARLVRTIYEGPGGQRGEGALDAAGNRTPPAPFGSDLPNVNDSGFARGALPTPAAPVAPTTPVATAPVSPAAQPPAATKPRVGAGCSVRAGDEGGHPTVLSLLALAILALARRPRSRR